MIGKGKREEQSGNTKINRLASQSTMTFGAFASTIDYTTTKPATSRPNLGTAATATNDGVEVANYADDVNYNFTVKNTGLNRSDDAVVTVNMDDLSTYLGDPVNDVQGFLTKKVTFSEGLLPHRAGQRWREDGPGGYQPPVRSGRGGHH